MKFMRFLSILVLITTLATQVSGSENPATKKLANKIEKVIINQVLNQLKEKDYESYVILSAMWQGIKNQSQASIERSLRQLLIEKGFIYTLYSKGYRYSETGMAFTFFSQEFFDWLRKEDKEYFEMVTNRYDYMIQAAIITNNYFKADSYFNVRTMLNRFKRASGSFPDDIPRTARYMADSLIATQRIPFKNRASLEDKQVYAQFVKDFEKYLNYNHAQRTQYKSFARQGRHRKISLKLRKQLGSYVHHRYIKKYTSPELLKQVYLEMISYTTRVTLSGDQEMAVSKAAGTFTALRQLLQKIDNKIKIKSAKLLPIRAALLARLKSLDKKSSPTKYTSIAAIYVLINNLVENSRSSVLKYQQSGSLYGAFSQKRGRYFKRYFVVPWFRNFYRRGWFGNEFLYADEHYSDFYGTMQVTAMITDYILSPNEKKLIKNFQQFAWLSMHHSAEVNGGYAKKLSENRRISRSNGLTESEMRLLDATFDYIFEVKSLSGLLTAMKRYMKENVPGGIYRKKALRELQKVLDESSFQSTPVLQYFYMRIARTLVKRAGLNELEANLAKIQRLVIEEALSWPGGRRCSGKFCYYTAKFDYELPALGSKIRALLGLIAAEDDKSLRSSLLTTYNKALDTNLQRLPKKVKSVSEPFIRTAMNSVVLGQPASMQEYTNVALQSIKGVEKGVGWLHFSVGFSMGYFSTSGFGEQANKVYLSDKIGIDFIGLGYDLAGANSQPWLGLGIFAGGVLDFLVSEGAKLETRTLVGGDNYLKTGLFLNFRHPENEILHFSIEGGAAFNLQGDHVFFLATSWNVFDVTDLF